MPPQANQAEKVAGFFLACRKAKAEGIRDVMRKFVKAQIKVGRYPEWEFFSTAKSYLISAYSVTHGMVGRCCNIYV